jgi:hypothetical protein
MASKHTTATRASTRVKTTTTTQIPTTTRITRARAAAKAVAIPADTEKTTTRKTIARKPLVSKDNAVDVQKNLKMPSGRKTLKQVAETDRDSIMVRSTYPSPFFSEVANLGLLAN